ncbi:hypothetical protein CLV80_10868 [Yoonia maritima]|uniref:Hemin transport protein n=1 Tax=Yoonia maritima TaxID=1435347 RepID=A0A2T0VX43_9RHOB|nr:hypothetical protein [Yoonia maritima]PRY76604.1 hypothetical protein CLV80_10868 [Yoonia maritima]
MPKLKAPCLCTSEQPLPRTLTALRQQGPVTSLGAGLDTLALVGTQLSDSLISTNNGVALLTGRGGYAPYQTSAMPFRLSRNRINMRIAPDVPTNLLRSKDTTNARQSLVLACAGGDISHRIETACDYDGRVINAIEAQNEICAAPQAPTIPGDVVPLAAVRNARDNWDQRETGHHLNDILLDGGVTRHTTLPYVGKSRAWPVAKQTLTSFVSFLCDRKIGHARLVPGSGFIQGDLATSGTAQMADKILLVSGDNSNFALDLAQIASVWVTRFGRLSQLEIYDEKSRAITILGADPAADITYWNALLESLPPASYSI